MKIGRVEIDAAIVPLVAVVVLLLIAGFQSLSIWQQILLCVVALVLGGALGWNPRRTRRYINQSERPYKDGPL